MAKTKRIGLRLGAFSWLRQCDVEEISKLTNNLLTPRKVKFWGVFDNDTIKPRNDDINHLVAQGDRIDRLSQKYYGDQMLWWVIAEKNNLDQPSIELWEGRMLVIPSPVFVGQQLAGRLG